MTAYLDLFSGIGGFALGAYWAGLRFEKHYFSEIDKYAVKVYQKRFPEAEPLGDIRNVDYAKLPRGEWLVTGGFPCQPHSVAGKKKGASDERDLWPECARMLRELRPAIALFENVPGLFVSNGGRFFNRVLSDVSEGGYDAEWQIISAQDAGAPHLRKRAWIVAYAGSFACGTRRPEPARQRASGIADGSDDMAYAELSGLEGFRGNTGKKALSEPRDDGSCMADTESGRCRNGNDGANQRQADRKINSFTNSSFSCGAEITSNAKRSGLEECNGERVGQSKEYQKFEPPHCQRIRKFEEERRTSWAVEPDVGRVAHGVPFRVDRLKGIGNAVVPQCVEMILRLPAFDLWRAA